MAGSTNFLTSSIWISNMDRCFRNQVLVAAA